MANVIGPVSTRDGYDQSLTAETTNEWTRLTGFVSNAPVFYELRGRNDPDWGPEKYIPSATGLTYFISFERKFVAIRFRSAVPGSPAVISFDLLTSDDLPSTF